MTERELFLAALAESDASIRSKLVARECGENAALKARIETLLRAHDQLEASSIEATTGYSPNVLHSMSKTYQPGTMITAKYKLLEEIGEGGMGTVYVAEQTEPVKRKVAIKLIKPGMDSKNVLARFEAERQALALMDHPNIARVLDAGLTEEHRPYFVMEYIKGLPLTKYCDDTRLAIDERLKLFIQICQAVQHAHQKGIIHRDLKPGNILIALYDGKPVPKVIDFGLAKALHQSLTERTLHTGHEMVLGTPLYMSPEQAELNNLDIDTRSDIYSLGVILYELLTGVTPLEKQRFKEAAWAEVLRIIKEEEPSKPSTKLSQSNSLPSVAAQRQMEPKKLSTLMKGDLDWIVMKALEKDRNRRYETANGFAADIQRYLTDEPVSAGPPGAGYRLRKFVRRNRGKVAAIGIVLISLMLGLIGTTWGFFQANAERIAAEQAKADADKARKDEVNQRMKAEQAEFDTLENYRASTNAAILQLIGSKPELGSQEKAYLKGSLERWQKYAQRQGTDERSLLFQAEGHYQVALIWYKLGRLDDARDEYLAAITFQEKLVEQFSEKHQYRASLARGNVGLGLTYSDQSQGKEAEVRYQKALGLLEKLVNDQPKVIEYRGDLALCHSNYGILLSERAQLGQAEEHFRKAIAIYDQLIHDEPQQTNHQLLAAKARCHLGSDLTKKRKTEEAEKQLLDALAIHTKLVSKDENAPEYLHGLADNHLNLGYLYYSLKSWEKAEKAYRQSQTQFTKLVTDFPSVIKYRTGLVTTYLNLGSMLSKVDRLKDAGEQYRLALAAHEKYPPDYQGLTRYSVTLGGIYCNLGSLQTQQGRPADAVTWLDKAIKVLTPLVESSQTDLKAKKYLENCYYHRAMACDLQKRFKEAVIDLRKLIALASPQDKPYWQVMLSHCLLRAGEISEAIAQVDEISTMEIWRNTNWFSMAGIYSAAAGKVKDKKQLYADKAIALLQKINVADFDEIDVLRTHKDFDSLRDRDDFKRILVKLSPQTAPITPSLINPKK